MSTDISIGLAGLLLAAAETLIIRRTWKGVRAELPSMDIVFKMHMLVMWLACIVIPAIFIVVSPSFEHAAPLALFMAGGTLFVYLSTLLTTKLHARRGTGAKNIFSAATVKGIPTWYRVVSVGILVAVFWFVGFYLDLPLRLAAPLAVLAMFVAFGLGPRNEA